MKAFPAASKDQAKSKTPDEWEISSAHDTLQKAEEIQKNPHMMKHVAKFHKKKKKEMTSVGDLIARRQAMSADNETAEKDDSEGKDE